MEEPVHPEEARLMARAQWTYEHSWTDEQGKTHSETVTCHSITGSLALLKWRSENHDRHNPGYQMLLPMDTLPA